MKLSKKIKKNLAALQYLKLRKKINENAFFFFFPFYHVGGAEQVHTDILEVFKNEKTLCFITNTSKNEAFKANFNKNSELLYMGNLIRNPFKKWVLKLISDAVNKKENPVVFGCNSAFFYDLVPYFAPHVKVIDLIHAFSENGPEIWSLPVAERIDYRVVLGKKTATDFKNLYENQNKPKELTNRLVIIPNKVEIPEILEPKSSQNTFQILYVGRNSPEKRVSILFQIAEKCLQKNLPVVFNIIGDFSNYTNFIPKNVTLVGELNDKKHINEYYKQSHLLLITSYREGFPMVILEGMSYGVIPISTDVGEISSLISEEKGTGWLIPNETNEAATADNFVNRIEYCINNPSVIQQFSENTFKCVKENFNFENFAAAYKDLFSKQIK